MASEPGLGGWCYKVGGALCCNFFLLVVGEWAGLVRVVAWLLSLLACWGNGDMWVGSWVA